MQELQLRVLPFRKSQPGVAFRACWRTAARPRAAYMPSQVLGACSQEGLPPRDRLPAMSSAEHQWGSQCLPAAQ